MLTNHDDANKSNEQIILQILPLLFHSMWHQLRKSVRQFKTLTAWNGKAWHTKPDKHIITFR